MELCSYETFRPSVLNCKGKGQNLKGIEVNFKQLKINCGSSSIMVQSPWNKCYNVCCKVQVKYEKHRYPF